MKKLLFLSILFLMGISAQAQRYDIITQDICWNTGSVDSSLTRYFLVSPLASTVKVLAHLNSAGQKVIPSGGTFSAGHCGCCGGTSTSTTTTSTPARSGLFNDGDTIKLGGQVRENTSLGGMGQYGLDATNWKYLNFSATDSFKIITPGLIDAAIDVGGLLQVNSLTGRVEFTPYAFPLTAGTDGQFQQYNSATNEMEWRSPYLTAIDTDSTFRFSVNGSSVSTINKQEIIVSDKDSLVGRKAPVGFIARVYYQDNRKTTATYQMSADSVSGFVNDNCAVIPAGNRYWVLQPNANNAYMPEWFGAIPGDNLSDSLASKKLVEWVSNSSISSRVEIGPGVFNDPQMIIAKNKDGGIYETITMTVSGASWPYAAISSIGYSTVFRFNNQSAAIYIQSGRSVKIENIYFSGTKYLLKIDEVFSSDIY